MARNARLGRAPFNFDEGCTTNISLSLNLDLHSYLVDSVAKFGSFLQLLCGFRLRVSHGWCISFPRKSDPSSSSHLIQLNGSSRTLLPASLTCSISFFVSSTISSVRLSLRGKGRCAKFGREGAITNDKAIIKGVHGDWSETCSMTSMENSSSVVMMVDGDWQCQWIAQVEGWNWGPSCGEVQAGIRESYFRSSGLFQASRCWGFGSWRKLCLLWPLSDSTVHHTIHQISRIQSELHPFSLRPDPFGKFLYTWSRLMLLSPLAYLSTSLWLCPTNVSKYITFYKFWLSLIPFVTIFDI